jgi:hypothetical protein
LNKEKEQSINLGTKKLDIWNKLCFYSFSYLANRKQYNPLFRFCIHLIDEKKVIHLIFYSMGVNCHFGGTPKIFSVKKIEGKVYESNQNI